MSFKGKLGYFWYYYKVHTIVGIIIAFFLFVLIRDIATSKDYAFYGTYFNAEQTFSAEEQMAAFAEYAGLDTENYDVYLDSDMYYSLTDMSETSLAASQKFTAMIYSGDNEIAESLQNPQEPSTMTNPIPVGIYVSDTPVISDAGCYYGDYVPVFGIVHNTKRTETAIKYLRFLGKEEAVKTN